MLSIDLTGKRAFVAGVADDGGFGFAFTRRKQSKSQKRKTREEGEFPAAVGHARQSITASAQGKSPVHSARLRDGA